MNTGAPSRKPNPLRFLGLGLFTGALINGPLLYAVGAQAAAVVVTAVGVAGLVAFIEIGRRS